MKNKVLNENNIIAAAAAICAAVMVAFPEVTESGAKSAIAIWLNSVVPVLLPFFIFADFIKRTADMERLPVRVYPAVMAILSGYPMGAKITGDLVKSGVLSPEKGRHILSYSLVTGPAFILGTIGLFIGSSKAALIVAVAHYLGAVCNGLMWQCKDGTCLERVEKRRNSETFKNNNILDNFTDAILAGFRAMAIVLAYLILFMILAELVENTGILGVLPGTASSSFFKGILEMTMGISALGMCDISIGQKVVLTSFLVSFGGMSVIGQSLSVSGGGWLHFSELLRIKLSHGLLAGIIAAAVIILGNAVFPGEFLV